MFGGKPVEIELVSPMEFLMAARFINQECSVDLMILLDLLFFYSVDHPDLMKFMLSVSTS